MTYNLEKITGLLRDSEKFSGESVHLLTKVDSTNAWLLEQSEVAGQVCLTECQVAGKGRDSKSWVSSEGGSVLLSIGWQLETECVEGLSLVSGLAVVKSLSEMGVTGAKLKWPNDIIMDNMKMGGILIEIARRKCVVGIGLNIKLPKAVGLRIDQPWSDLGSLGYNIDRDVLVAKLILNHEIMFNKYFACGFSYFTAKWNEHHQYQNQFVDLQVADEVFSGEMLGVNDNGALLVKSGGKIRKFRSGEVSIQRVTS